MRAARLLAPLWVLNGSLVAANYDSRGPEVEFFYRAYRMDVDVSVAEFLADPKNAGKDPNVEKPWKLGRNIAGINYPEDWPGTNTVPRGVYGLNFHSWAAGVDKGGYYGRTAARTRIADPMDPDFKAAFADVKTDGKTYDEPRRNIMRLQPESFNLDPYNSDGEFDDPDSLRKYSWTGMNPNFLLGDLNKAKRGAKLGDYFEFDNLLGLTAKRCSELYEKNPTVAGPHYAKMAHALEQAHLGRQMESRAYKITGAEKTLAKYETDTKSVGEGTLSGWRAKDKDGNIIKPEQGIIRTMPASTPNDPNSWYPGWEHKDLDVEETRKKWPKDLSNHKVGFVGDPKKKTTGALGDFAGKWAKGDLSYLAMQPVKGKKGVKEEKRRAMDGFASDHTHLQVMRAEHRLSVSIRAQIADPNASAGAPGCMWYATRDPGGGKGGLPDPLRKRLAMMATEQNTTATSDRRADRALERQLEMEMAEAETGMRMGMSSRSDFL
ncbi:hypothetical protein OQA88_10218 [Cercophora sp. LCS_1]